MIFESLNLFKHFTTIDYKNLYYQENNSIIESNWNVQRDCKYYLKDESVCHFWRVKLSLIKKGRKFWYF